MQTKQFILLGPPGVEVPAHAAALAQRWRSPHISAADLRPSADEPGDDDTALKAIRRRLEQPDAMLKGWVLDGFPQTLAQAQAFDRWWDGFGQSPLTVVYLKATTGILISRLSAQQPRHEPPSALRARIEGYQERVAPLLEHYQVRSQLTSLNASRPFAEVARDLAQLGYEETGAARIIPDEAELDRLLAQAPLLVVDCMASWCGSCKQVTPLIDRLADAYGDRVAIVKIDFDVNRQITKRFQLQGIPAVMFFRAGALVETLIGVKAYPEYDAAVSRLLASP